MSRSLNGRTADITVQDGRVVHIGAGTAADRVIDCTGLFVLPAAVDVHVHMRGGSQSAKEDWTTGSMSALAGGVTVVVDQPNTVPPLTTPDAFLARVRRCTGTLVLQFCNKQWCYPGFPFRGDVGGRGDGIWRDLFCPLKLR